MEHDLQTRSDNPRVTVVLPVYKTPIDWLKVSTSSILNQTYPNVNVLIIDDGSNCGEIKRFLIKLERLNDNVRVFENATNKGLVYTLNRALTLADDELIVRMDSDDYSRPERIERQVEFLCSTNLDVVSSFMVGMSSGNQQMISSPCAHSMIAAVMPWRCCIFHPSVMYKKSVVEEVGGYPDVQYAEDYALWSKLLMQTDVRFGAVSEALIEYRFTNGRDEYFRIQCRNTNLVRREWLKWAGIKGDDISLMSKFYDKSNLTSGEFRRILAVIDALNGRLASDKCISMNDLSLVRMRLIRRAVKSMGWGPYRLFLELKRKTVGI